MKQFLSVNDVSDLPQLLEEALQVKAQPRAWPSLGRNKTLGLVFFNPSLRTRLSTQKAAQALGLETLMININQEGWQIETRDGVIMDEGAGEHIKEAAGVLGQYCDIIGLRCFPGLKDRETDLNEEVLKKFAAHCARPLLSLESATLHPLQSLADVITIMEKRRVPRPKVVLTWAPHIKALPQAVPHSFAEWILRTDSELVITHPEGYELHPRFTAGAKIEYDQDQALAGADFVYAKNWSTLEPYGQTLPGNRDWMISPEKMALTNQAYFMHCLPLRRNLEVSEHVLDGPRSLVLEQAHNRIFAAQIVLKRMLEALPGTHRD